MRWRVVIGCALALGACDGGGLALRDLPDAVDRARCERLARCGTYVTADACIADAVNYGPFGPEPRLPRQFVIIDPLVTIDLGIRIGAVVYDGDAASECVAAIRDASCDLTSALARVPAAACDRVFTGTVADGGTCYADAECVSQRCQPFDCGQACCPGACDHSPRAHGDACGPGWGPCPVDSVCGPGGTCDPLQPLGAPCNAPSECDFGLTCASSNTCVEAPRRGDRCAGVPCGDAGDQCSIDSMTCAPYHHDGDFCMPGIWCQPPLYCHQGTCEWPHWPGEDCIQSADPTATVPCAPGAFCNAGTCEQLRAEGDACTSDAECATGHCAGQCQPAPTCNR